jgi:hypothetical protein
MTASCGCWSRVRRSQDGAGSVRDGASPVHGDGAGSVPETVHLLSALADARVAAARAEGECVALRAQVTDLRAERDMQAAAHARERETLQAALALARRGWFERLLEVVRR